MTDKDGNLLWYGEYTAWGRLKNGEVSDGLEDATGFVWDGSHLLQEIHPDGRYTYIYTDPDSYEPLAQVRDWTTEDDENRQQTRYFHCDQIGIPREMTDKDGNLLWFGNYTGWGRLKEETRVTDTAYQPFRLQNQYADRETGLHYNFFRYYEPDAGRFVNQDPIGLYGGDNFYQFAPNIQLWLDVLGLCRYGRRRKDGKCPKKRGPKRKGGAHNKTISALAKEVERCGGKVVAGGRKGKPERVIDTPGGHKESRRPDITWIDSSGITHHGNVGKGHKRPILREREAIEDLEKALAGQPDTHEKVTFWSYTNSKCQPKLCD